MFRYAAPAGAAALLALAACAAAPPPAPVDASMVGPAIGPKPTKLTGYLAPDDLDGIKIVGPPPAADSIRGKADRATFEETRAMAGTPRWQAAIVDNDLWNGGALKRYACAMGRDIGETTTPVLSRLLHRVELDVRTVGTPPKNFYNRDRPLIGNDKPICVPREDWMKTNASYPSGHSTVGWAWALILSEAQPQSATAVLNQGREMGTSRVICGVHFESDVEAGRTLGSAMVARLHADPTFTADLAAAKRELAGAPAPSGCGG